MHCYSARQSFSDYYDGALPHPSLRRLEVHLSACSDCRADYSRFEGALGSLAELAPEDVLRIEAETDVDEIIGGGVAPFELAKSGSSGRAAARSVTPPPRPARPFDPSASGSGRHSFVSRLASGLRAFEERRPYVGVAAAAAFFALGLGIGIGLADPFGLRAAPTVVADGAPEREPAPRVEPQPEPEPETAPETQPAPEAQPEPQAIVGPEPEKAPEPTPQPAPEKEPETTIAQKQPETEPGVPEGFPLPPRNARAPEMNTSVKESEPAPVAAPTKRPEPAPALPAAPAAAPTEEDIATAKPLRDLLAGLRPLPGWRYGTVTITPLALEGAPAEVEGPRPSTSGFGLRMSASERPDARFSRFIVSGRNGDERVVVLPGEVFKRGANGLADRVAGGAGLVRPSQSIELAAVPLTGLTDGEVARTESKGPWAVGVMVPTRARAMLLAGEPASDVEEEIQRKLAAVASARGTVRDGATSLTDLHRECYDGNTRRFISAKSGLIAELPQVRGVAIAIGGQLRSIEVFGSHEDLCGAVKLILTSALVEETLEQPEGDLTVARDQADGVNDFAGQIAELIESAVAAAPSASPKSAARTTEVRIGAYPSQTSGYALVDEDGSIVHAVVFERMD